jgi:hypothetical protein
VDDDEPLEEDDEEYVRMNDGRSHFPDLLHDHINSKYEPSDSYYSYQDEHSVDD